MKILTINSGSTSIKFKLFDMPGTKVLAFGKIDNIGGKVSQLNYQKGDYIDKEGDLTVPDHKMGLELILNKLTDSSTGVISDIKEIQAVGHRVVNIGDKAKTSLKIDKEVIKSLEQALDLAPLHNPPNLTGIKVCQKILGTKTPNIAVFDNLFHKDMPEKAYLYGIPFDIYETYKVRKYGFHGIAYSYMIKRLGELFGKEVADKKIIALMLGGGSSITAIHKGKTKDTSMGFTPAEGLIMSTRSGDLDPAIIPFLMKKRKLDVEGIEKLINKESGLLGLSKKFGNFKDIEDGLVADDEDCKRAFLSYCYRIKKYIGSYAAALNGIDVIVFGGGIGENSYLAREEILMDLDVLGIKLDKNKNKKGHGLISESNSKVLVCVVDVDEELILAEETYELSV